MKKILTLTLALVMALSLTACSKPTQNADVPPSSSSKVDTDSLTSEPESVQNVPSNSKVNLTLKDFQSNSGDETYMKAVTEDYFLYENSVGVDGLLFEQTIHSYDEKGNCVSDCSKSIYESETAAKEQYDYRKKFDNDNSVLQGTVLYSSSTDVCSKIKADDWKYYLWWIESDADQEKLYFSKPLSVDTSSTSADSAPSVAESQGETPSNDGNIYGDKLKFAADTTITEQDIKLLKATTEDYCTSVAVVDGLEELIVTSFDKDGKVVNIDMRSQCENADKTEECFDGTYYDYIDNSLKKAIDNYVYISGFKDGLSKSDYLGFAQSSENGAYYFSKN